MKTMTLISLAALSLCAGTVAGQERPPQLPPGQSDSAQRPGPPPQAYEDCKGKKAGDSVQHTTPEGKVAATCMDSPKGLVARPLQARPLPAGGGKP
jgi:hypothetical protein